MNFELGSVVGIKGLLTSDKILIQDVKAAVEECYHQNEQENTYHKMPRGMYTREIFIKPHEISASCGFSITF